jgi:hypothetical protein
MKQRRILTLWLLGSTGLMFGCGHHNRDDMAADETTPRTRHVSSGKEEDFPDEDQVRQVDRFAGIQAAAGAQDDSTLHMVHFTGNRLNSLGESKINLMMQNHRADDSMMIYLDMPKDMSEARRSSVEKYVAGLGVAPEHVKVAAGINPQSTTPSFLGMQGLQRTDSDHRTGEAPQMNQSPAVTAGGASTTSK